MNRMYYNLMLILLLVCGFVNNLFSQDFVAVPVLTGRVIDNAGILTETNKRLLESRLSSLEREKGSQIVVLTIPSTKPETIEQYSIRVADKWKIGRKGIDDGIILIVAKEDRTVRIEVGYGLEGTIPDVIAKRILNEIILPSFRKGNFNQGIIDGCYAIAKIIRGESLPDPNSKDSKGMVRGVNESDQWIFKVIFIGVGILFGSFGILLNIFGSKKKAMILFLIAVLMIVGLSFLFKSWVMATFISGIFSFIVGIFMMIASGSRPSFIRNSGSGYSHESGGFGGSSGGGSSGWSGGGGGGFGGGGSSGSW